MIIEFTLANFLSIREEQTFSFHAESASDHLIDNVANPINSNIGVLKTVGVYGANASGKSNLLQAFHALEFIICKSGDLKEGDKIPCYEPYLLSEASKSAPVKFEIEFIAKNKLRYIYKVAFNSQRILTESLGYYSSHKPANLFKRRETDTWKTIDFGTKYTGGKRRLPFFDNNSYLAKAGNSADAPKIIREIFNFFRQDMHRMSAHKRSNISVLNWSQSEELTNDIALILSKIDTGILSFTFKEKEIPKISFPDSLPEDFRQQILEHERKEPVFLHQGVNGYEAEFTRKMESEGTLKLFNTLPLLMMVLQEGDILFIDELDTHFHPHIAELIIKLFNDPSVNRNNAQLIFSTHNINLMSPELMRRDQIWLTQKNQGETTLTSLDEFDKAVVKINSPFHKWYDDGRFGAIPQIDAHAIVEIIQDRMS